MKQRFLIALALAGAFFFASTAARAQTNVTATIKDRSGIAYANGTFSIQLVPTGTPTVGGVPIAGTNNGRLDANGSFNIALYANSSISPGGSQWQFTICAAPGVAPPLGTGGQCTPPTLITITSPGPQSVSATLSAVAPPLTTMKLTGFPGLSSQGLANTFTDYFFRTGSTLGGNYTPYVNNLTVSAGSVTGNTSNWTLAAYIGASTSASANATTIVHPDATGFAGTATRIGGTPLTSANYYALVENTTNLFLVKRTGDDGAGGATQYAAVSIPVTTTSNDSLNLRSVGNTHTAYWNRTGAVLQWNDGSAPLTTGLQGPTVDGTTNIINSFTVRNATAAPGTNVNIVVAGDSVCEGAGVFTPYSDYLTLPGGKIANVTNICIDGSGLSETRAATSSAGASYGASGAGSIESWVTLGTVAIDPLCVPGAQNVVVFDGGRNDISDGITPTALYAAFITFVAARHANAGCPWKVVAAPLLSEITQDTKNLAYDQLLFANTAGADAIVPYPPSLINANAYLNTLYFQTPGGVHPTQLVHSSVIPPLASNSIASVLN